MSDAPTPIDALVWREVATAEGAVRSIRFQQTGGAPRTELIVFDDTGGLRAFFTTPGPTEGIRLGDRVILRGRVGERSGTLAMMNPEIHRAD